MVGSLGSWYSPLRMVTAVFALSALLVACGSAVPAGSARGAAGASPPASADKQLVPLTVETSFIASASQLPIFLALGRGYYRAAGLAVTVTQGKGAALTAQQVGAGAFDIGQTDMAAMALARAKGTPIRAFMAEFDRTTFGVFGAKSEGIQTWKDLYGKKVLVSAGSPETFLLPATLAKEGLDAKRVQIVNVAAADKESDYMAGDADAMGTDLAGAIPRVDARRASDHLWFGDVLNVLGYGFVARTAYLKAHAPVVRAFAQATGQALQALRTDPRAAGEAAQDLVRFTPNGVFSATSIAAAWPDYERFLKFPAGRPLGWQSAAAWRSTLQVLHDYAGFRGDTNPAADYTNAMLTQAVR